MFMKSCVVYISSSGLKLIIKKLDAFIYYFWVFVTTGITGEKVKHRSISSVSIYIQNYKF